MKKPDKKLIVSKTEYPNSIYPNCSTDLNVVAAEIQNLISQGFTTLVIDYDSYVEDEWQGSSDCLVKVISEREETDEEFEARVAKWQQDQKKLREANKKRKEEREARERKEFERLSKKYGG